MYGSFPVEAFFNKKEGSVSEMPNGPEEMQQNEKKSPKERVQFDFSSDALSRLDQLKTRLDAGTRAEVIRLAYAGIDLLLTPEGRYVYPELNAPGQFGWLQGRTGVPLYHTLAMLLIQGKRP
jgi:hypothetical protein